MRHTLLWGAVLAVMLSLGVAGCSDTKTTATPDEQARYKDPVLEPPAEAGNMGGPGPSGGGSAAPGPPPPPPPGAQAGPG